MHQIASAAVGRRFAGSCRCVLALLGLAVLSGSTKWSFDRVREAG